jgi:hypothetical protein
MDKIEYKADNLIKMKPMRWICMGEGKQFGENLERRSKTKDDEEIWELARYYQPALFCILLSKREDPHWTPKDSEVLIRPEIHKMHLKLNSQSV